MQFKTGSVTSKRTRDVLFQAAYRGTVTLLVRLKNIIANCALCHAVHRLYGWVLDFQRVTLLPLHAYEQFYLCSYVEYGLPCTFSPRNLQILNIILYRISSKSIQKYGEYGEKFIVRSSGFTCTFEQLLYFISIVVKNLDNGRKSNRNM